MARIYANLIKKNKKTLNDVPLKDLEAVKAILIAEGYQIDEGE